MPTTSRSSTRQLRTRTASANTKRNKSHASVVEVEVEPRLCRIEQQLQERLPMEWREFAGKPMALHYYDKKINTFRANDDVKPSAAYMRWAVKQLRGQLEAQQLSVFSDAELREIVQQEWRTDLTRSTWEARLNRHGSADGPVVRRSPNGVIFVRPQPQPGEKYVQDGMAVASKQQRQAKYATS
ncbi:hypothetical protein Poli38472_003766 [Pythium oligandrum]|uniref:Uncharacterized protein n=1 Tax=Pythium oligandrum TaxID=41045 RepID=A0A8K1FKF5_PYTOL|nr:hypothetical protein Poli38472_003766 [Pythium oligandrum]|eukprot:TMW66001.1 hypothetical protein Poli38472_003766 [Pythium oligandrum]